jgi:hypothetical protein
MIMLILSCDRRSCNQESEEEINDLFLCYINQLVEKRSANRKDEGGKASIPELPDQVHHMPAT